MCNNISRNPPTTRLSGMATYPSKINFKMTTYDDTLESLWALDAAGRAYHYNEGVWILVDKQMNYISAGSNGVFGIKKDSKLYQREGITTSRKSGTSWKVLIAGDWI